MPASVAASTAGSGSASFMVNGSNSCTDRYFNNVTATPGNGQVMLSWTAAPALAAASPSYTVGDGATTSGGESPDPAFTNTTATNATVPNLSNGVPYYFEVTADSNGYSITSCEVSATPVPPSAGGGSGAGGSVVGSGAGGSVVGSGAGGSVAGGSGTGGSGATGSVMPPIISAGIGLLVIAVVVVGLRRLRRRSGPVLMPPPSVRVVRDAGPPIGVHVQPTGTRPTVAVRIEPHPGVSTTLIEEMQR